MLSSCWVWKGERSAGAGIKSCPVPHPRTKSPFGNQRVPDSIDLGVDVQGNLGRRLCVFLLGPGIGHCSSIGHEALYAIIRLRVYPNPPSVICATNQLRD